MTSAESMSGCGLNFARPISAEITRRNLAVGGTFQTCAKPQVDSLLDGARNVALPPGDSLYTGCIPVQSMLLFTKSKRQALQINSVHVQRECQIRC